MSDIPHDNMSGAVAEQGEFDSDDQGNVRMSRTAEKIETHGEVHAVFEGVDGEIDLRLATTLLDYDTNEFLVWDGDVYHNFAVGQMTRSRKPMEP